MTSFWSNTKLFTALRASFPAIPLVTALVWQATAVYEGPTSTPWLPLLLSCTGGAVLCSSAPCNHHSAQLHSTLSILEQIKHADMTEVPLIKNSVVRREHVPRASRHRSHRRCIPVS